jgi:hypothetical protein
MLIVPVKGDRIRTKDDSQYHRVSSFSSLKDEPAVYIKPAGTDPFVYFSDIVEINGVRVEYDSSSKVFNALGPLKRKYNIPQPKDSIFVKLLSAPKNYQSLWIFYRDFIFKTEREKFPLGFNNAYFFRYTPLSLRRVKLFPLKVLSANQNQYRNVR